MIINRKAYPKVDALLKAAIPGNRKHDAIISVAGKVEARTYWSGGSQSSYLLSSLNGQTQHLRGQDTPEPFGKFDPEIHMHTVPAGQCVIKVGTFNGRTAAPVIYASVETFKQLGVEASS